MAAAPFAQLSIEQPPKALDCLLVSLYDFLIAGWDRTTERPIISFGSSFLCGSVPVFRGDHGDHGHSGGGAGGSDSPSGVCTMLTYIGALNGAGSLVEIIWALFPVEDRQGLRAQSRARHKTNTRPVMVLLWMRLKDMQVFHSFTPPLLQGERQGYAVICEFLIPSLGRACQDLKRGSKFRKLEVAQEEPRPQRAEPAERN